MEPGNILIMLIKSVHFKATSLGAIELSSVALSGLKSDAALLFDGFEDGIVFCPLVPDP